MALTPDTIAVTIRGTVDTLNHLLREAGHQGLRVDIETHELEVYGEKEPHTRLEVKVYQSL